MTVAPVIPAPPLTPAKVGVLLVVTAEAMYFAGLMAAYLVLKSGHSTDGDPAKSCLRLAGASLLVHGIVTALATVVPLVRGRPLHSVAPLWIFVSVVALVGTLTWIGS